MSSRNDVSTVSCGGGKLKRQLFWRNIVKQHNFTDENERKLIITYLTNGINWMELKMLPKAFVQRHRGIYHFICTPIYPTRSNMIERDVTRTFSIFQKSCIQKEELPLQQKALFRVLNAIGEAENGYCQGMNFIAAIFLVEGLEEADAYVLFLYLLQKRHLARLFHQRSTFLDDYLIHFEKMFEQELPDLYQHMTSQGFTPPMYGIEWFTTLFSLSTKFDLSCAIFDLFLIGIVDIFLRMGLSILKLLEAKLMCMQFEDFLQDFKPLVKEIDPYQAILKALTFRPNSPSLSFPAIKTTTKTTFMSFSSSTQQQQEQQQQQQQQLQLQQKHHHQKQQFIQEDTIVYLSRLYFQQHSSNRIKQNGRRGGIPPRTFELHRTLPPNLSQAIMKGNLSIVKEHWYQMMNFVPATKLNSSRVSTTQKDHLLSLRTTILIKDIEILLANEILHFSIWYGQVFIAQFAIEEAGANVNNMDDNQLTPLHFSVLRNQPDLARLLLSFGANRSLCGGTWSGSIQGLTPLETAKYWIFCDTKAVQLVLENEICIYCNTKFDKVPVLHLVAFEGNSICCEKCQLHFCRLPQPCLHQHLCPKKENYHCLQQQQPKEQEEEEEDIDETTSTSSSLSATTEPFVMINYPSSTTINNQTNENITSPHENENSHSGSLLLKQFIKSTAKWKSQIDSDHHRKQKQMNRKMSIEFSKIPQWYCNHVDCHQVFASFFKNANECTKCKGLFCSIHIIVQNSNTVDVSKLCVQCNTV